MHICLICSKTWFSLFIVLQKGDQKPNKDFKKTRTNDDVNEVFTEFIGNDEQIRVRKTAIINIMIILMALDRNTDYQRTRLKLISMSG